MTKKKGQTTLWPKEKRTDNTIAKKKEGQTTLWPKKDRQHYDQIKRRTDNTMVKRKKTNSRITLHRRLNRIYILYIYCFIIIFKEYNLTLARDSRD